MTIEFDGQNNKLGTTTANSVTIKTNDTDRVVVNSSGDFMIGTTSEVLSDSTGTGSYLDISKGTLQIKASGNAPLIANRVASDGVIAQFRKDGTTVGSISSSGTNFIVSGSGTVSGVRFNSNGMLPVVGGSLSDNTEDLGQNSYRWKDLYLGGNIYLGGTGSANALDDYEEGTWTPLIKGSTSAGTASYTVRLAKYVKVGKVVHIQAFIDYGSGTGTGNFWIEGLPFITESTGNLYSSMSIAYLNNIAYTAGRTPMIYVNHSGSDRLLLGQSNPSGAWTAIPYDGTGAIIFAGTYITN